MNDVQLSSYDGWMPVKIEQQQIIDAALALLDAEGLERLNMRSLAERLGVYASALYWHVGGKDELISFMATSFYVRAFDAAPKAETWRDWLLAFGRAFRAALLSHHDSARLCAIAKPVTDKVLENAEKLAAPLVARGLDQSTALSYQGSVISLTLGWVIYQQSNALHDYLARMFDFDASFETALTSMIRGFPDPDHHRIGRRIQQ